MLLRLVRASIPLLVVAAGVTAFFALTRSRPEAEWRDRADPGALVEVMPVVAGTQKVTVMAHGTVTPAREVTLGPEVSGRVVWVNDRLSPGSRFEEGELLVRVDPREYKLAAKQQLAAVDRALTELELEKGRRRIAEREWELFDGRAAGAAASRPDGEEDDERPLALREPQLRTARASLEATRSALEQAHLAVSRTAIRAPFNAMVVRESVELGQMVGPMVGVQASLVTLVGTDTYRVQVSVPVDRLSWIAIPGIAGAVEGAPARVLQEVADGRWIERAGRVVRLLGDVDPAGRMARLLIEIDDPLGLAPPPATPAEGLEAFPPLPLLLGSFVEVEIEGREVDRVVAIPREALRDGDRVYLASDQGTLLIREVEVIWRREASVLVHGLEDDDQIVVSPVPAPVEGMKIRTGRGAGREAKAEAARAP